jgi:hypothetical protein
MALGNYNSISWNEKGKPIEGFFKTPHGVMVEIYKNWLYLSDGNRKEIAHIDSGILYYKDLHLVAIRGKRQGIYFVAWTENYKHDKAVYKAMFGIACYAYIKRKPILISKDQVDFLQNKLKEWNKNDKTSIYLSLDELSKVKLEYNKGSNQGMEFIFRAIKHNYVGKNVKKLNRTKMYKIHK